MMISPSSAAVDEGGAATISAVHPDIIGAHILTRLDGPTLASSASASSQLHSLSREPGLWSNICRSTWPSTASPRVTQIISSFPNGYRSFFSDSFPLPCDDHNNHKNHIHHDHNHEMNNLDRTIELISAVDVHYRGEPILSKVVETETVSGWFRCSPFRIDLLHPKEVVPTGIPYPSREDTCCDLIEGLTLSWIVIDPIRRRAMNLSSHNKPVEVERHWLSGEVHVRFASVLPWGGSSSEFTQCGVQVTCGGSHTRDGGGLQVREVCLVMEDMDGTHLKGREILVILQRALEGKRGKGGVKRREEEGRKRYQEYLERKRERKERRVRTEGALDMLFAFFFGAFAFSLLSVGIFHGLKRIPYW